MAETPEIPIIDFRPFLEGSEADRQDVVRRIREASQEMGFFCLSGHGLDRGVLARAFQASRGLFAMPMEEKQAVAWQNASSNRGYVGMRRESLDPNRAGDQKEAFNIGPEVDPATLTEDARPYRENRWPEGHPGFRQDMLAFLDSCIALSERVLEAFAESLELPRDFFVDTHDQHDHTLRLLHYPPIPAPDERDGDNLRAGGHTDYGSITLLFQDGVGGLEARALNGEWVQVPPLRDAVVINTGDLMERWTNHVFRSTPHRVRFPTGEEAERDRFSIAFFCHPNMDAQIACLENCCDADNPPRYQPITAQAHLMERLNATY